MINYWWVTRPKRTLDSIPEVLATFAGVSLDQEWQKQRPTHLSLEESLEQAGLKRVGERRDQTGGGGRTYQAWLFSLGLILIQRQTNQVKLTLAGEAIMDGNSPVEILKAQVLKYQYPSPFSLAPKARKSTVSPRFRIRPFRFLLRLMMDSRIQYLTQEEVAKIVIVEAENETENCFNHIVERLLAFRTDGDCCLSPNFISEYAPTTGIVNPEHPYSHLTDVANTLFNWLEYTQLARRDDGIMGILEEKFLEVQAILGTVQPFIDRPEDEEYFQRKYGLDPQHQKDTRNLLHTDTITPMMIANRKIQQAFIIESLKKPISRITSSLIDTIADSTGISSRIVEDSLIRMYPHGAVSAFMSNYFEMAFRGRDEATDFEKATRDIFRDVLGFTAEHVGPLGLTPDVFVLSDQARFVGIIDNKAYSKYSISNDHYNRMVHNYIPRYQSERYPLRFFSYIAGGFASNIDARIRDIYQETHVNGSAVPVSTFIKMIEKGDLEHTQLLKLFSCNRQLSLGDV